jgi:type III pantothenate kinase
LPLKIDYKTPTTLGFDRIANCIGAIKLFPKVPLLVIDSGTCITYNQVGASGVFLGGNISPGVEIRFKSLHHYTAKLPCLSPIEWEKKLGNTTEEAIRNGVMLGVLFEMKGYIEQMQSQENDLKVVITGGNAHWLRNELENEVFWCENLGLLGLNEVLIYTKKCRVAAKSFF